MFGYQCTVRTQNPTRQFVLLNNMEQTNRCDAISIPEWKLALMAKAIFDRVWGDQKQAVMTACDLIKQAQNGIAQTSQESLSLLNHKIEKLKIRKRNFSTMYADGDLTREEYREMSSQADDEIQKLQAEQRAGAESKMSDEVMNVARIKKALEGIVDISTPRIDDKLIERFVEVVTPVEDTAYRWKLNFGEIPERNKRTNLVEISTAPVLAFTIGFNEAKAYRKANHMPTQFRESAWHDLYVEVYL